MVFEHATIVTKKITPATKRTKKENITSLTTRYA